MPRAGQRTGPIAVSQTRAPDQFWTPIAGAALLAVVSLAVSVGADSMWLVALGKEIARGARIPDGVPFASASSRHWPNVPVLGELLFAGLHQLGTLALPIAQLLIAGVTLGLTMTAARRMGARDGAAAIVLLVTALGALPALGVLRAQSLSLIPFALLVILLRSESVKPSRRLWLAPALLALWGNLHGAVLLGVAVTGCYLIFARARVAPATAAAALACSVLAVGANPAGVRSVAYYAGVLSNEAARRHTGLWARPSLTSGFDVLLLLAAVLLVAPALRGRPRWEYPAIGGLAIATLSADRNGVWLLLFCAAPAAAGLSRLRSPRAPEEPSVLRVKRALATGFSACALLLVIVLLASRSAKLRTPSEEAATVRAVAHGRVVLAPEPFAETLAEAGVRVWLSNPIDAFGRQDQDAYLDFVAGHGPAATRALSAADIVVAEPGSKPESLATQAGFSVVGRAGTYDVLARG